MLRWKTCAPLTIRRSSPAQRDAAALHALFTDNFCRPKVDGHLRCPALPPVRSGPDSRRRHRRTRDPALAAARLRPVERRDDPAQRDDMRYSALKIPYCATVRQRTSLGAGKTVAAAFRGGPMPCPHLSPDTLGLW